MQSVSSKRTESRASAAMQIASELFGRLLKALAMCAWALLFAMTMIIATDVLLRNMPLVAGLNGLAWSNEVSEALLYLVTLLMAPWLLRRGQHIRVDIVLTALPAKIGWGLEWVSDAIGAAACIVMSYYALLSTIESYASSAMTIKTLITPEWWLFAPMPAAFALLTVEFIFRMWRLQQGPRVPRADAVSAG